jgi:hypothetical protein
MVATLGKLWYSVSISWLPTPFASFPLHFPSRVSACAIRFQLAYTLAKKMALIKWMLASSCDRQDSKRKWRKHGCRSRSERTFWSVYTFFWHPLYVSLHYMHISLYNSVLINKNSALPPTKAHCLSSSSRTLWRYDNSTTNPPQKHVCPWVCYNEKCVGEIYA